jgi:organic hydroperoxide reductase OsmC/OhrA
MHTCKTTVEWKEGLIGDLRTESGSRMDFSTTPEFGGPARLITPEELFVAAENTCYMMTFLAFINKMRIELVSYDCEAVGHVEPADKGSIISKIELRPKIVVKSDEHAEKIPKAIELSQKYCFIENSIKTKVEIVPMISVSP